MKVIVYPTRNYIEERDIKDKVAVVIDVLRATSTIITALYNGCKEVIPTDEYRRGSKAFKKLRIKAPLF